MRFEFMFLEAGPIPPEAGPLREEYLDARGRESLGAASAALVAGRSRVHLTGAPAFEMFPATEDPEARRAIQVSLRSKWNVIRRRTGQRSLDTAEPFFRRAEKEAVAALNYLEDHELAETAHIAVHEAAFYRSGLYGCAITWRDGEYWTRCPARLAHIRIGMSAGLTGDFECSACGEAIEDCDHIPGAMVEHLALTRPDGACSICREATCGHAAGQTYLEPVVPWGVSISAHEVTMVRRPRYPQARFTAVTLELGTGYERVALSGHLNCDECLGPCQGLRESSLWVNP